ncbi:hypothetical protein [Flavobacterium ovatum]|uniref:hypothetical protein n=1 Tax=Flavobacterium ovatum TaxID=1928857 RepID=UPI0034509C7B
MDMQLTKMELIEMLLNTKKESVLNKIKAILESEQEQLAEGDYKILETRRENHLQGKSKSYTWDEVRKNLAS